MQGLREGTIERLRAVLDRRPEIFEAYLFGSGARGDAARHSDIDVAVYVDASVAPDAPFGYDAALGADLMRAVGDSRVDVVVLNHAPPLLYHRVLRDGMRLLSRDLAQTTTREGRALSRWCDWQGQLRKLDAVARERVLRGDFGR